MGAAQKKRLLAAQERFRRNWFYYFHDQINRPDGGMSVMMHLEKRIPNHRRVWK